VGAVLVGAEGGAAVLGNADTLRIKARIAREAGVLPGGEVVRAAGEIELVGGVLRRCSWPQRRTVALGTKARTRVVSIPSIIEDFDDGRAHSVGASFVAVVAPPLVTEPSGFQALTNGG